MKCTLRTTLFHGDSGAEPLAETADGRWAIKVLNSQSASSICSSRVQLAILFLKRARRDRLARTHRRAISGRPTNRARRVLYNALYRAYYRHERRRGGVRSNGPSGSLMHLALSAPRDLAFTASRLITAARVRARLTRVYNATRAGARARAMNLQFVSAQLTRQRRVADSIAGGILSSFHSATRFDGFLPADRCDFSQLAPVHGGEMVSPPRNEIYHLRTDLIPAGSWRTIRAMSERLQFDAR